jgi:mono/diheme cytochrome c family protein
MWRSVGLVVGGLVFGQAALAADQEISVERGRLIAIKSGCHDCHTDGYAASEGRIDPDKALAGSRIGWRGPWGTTFPSNLRLVAAGLHERGFVLYLSTLRTLPPMPWFNVVAMDDAELRSLYRYIRSLGEPGEPAPAYAPPDQEPAQPYFLMEPVQASAP